MGPISDRRPSKSKFVRSLSLRNLRKSESTSSSSEGSCVVVVGSTGTGKSSTIARYTGCHVRTGSGTESVTEQCTVWPGKGNEAGPVWVDTRGWEDRATENTNTFQETLKFLNKNGLLKISAVVWCVSPNIRHDETLQRQAEFIDQFYPKSIWDVVIIICKQSVNPVKDAAGAIKAAESFSKAASSRVLGYRYLEDPSLSQEQREALEENVETRKLFNVLTDDEIVTLLRSSLQSLPAPVQVVFLDQRCVDCGEEGDRRLLSPFCHLEKCLKHPGRLQRVHPGGVERYHLSEEQLTLHPGHLKSPWYRDCLPNTNKIWSCCKASESAGGCRTLHLCCRQEQKEEGCRKRYACCLRPTDFSGGGSGCELVFSCCRRGADSEGCQETCVKCGRRWGLPAINCYRREHKLIKI